MRQEGARGPLPEAEVDETESRERDREMTHGQRSKESKTRREEKQRDTGNCVSRCTMFLGLRGALETGAMKLQLLLG